MDIKKIPEFHHEQYIALFNNRCFNNATIFEIETTKDNSEIVFNKTAGLIDYNKLINTKIKEISQKQGFYITLKKDKEFPYEWTDKEGNVHEESVIFPAGLHHFEINFCNVYEWQKFSEMTETKKIVRENNGESNYFAFLKECFDKPKEIQINDEVEEISKNIRI